MRTAKLVKCSYCDNDADPRFRKIEGWEELRGRGGANHVIARHDTGQRACTECMHGIKLGLRPGEARLW